MTDGVVWVLVAIAVVITAVAIGLIGEVTAAEACGQGRMETLVLCAAGPARWQVLAMALIACVAWCLVGIRVARRSR